MTKIKVGDTIWCQVDRTKAFPKIIPIITDETIVPEPFKIIHKYQEGDVDYYSVVIPDDFVGWTISVWHIERQHISEQYLNKKFFDVSEVGIW